LTQGSPPAHVVFEASRSLPVVFAEDSDLILELFGPRVGVHARSSIGMVIPLKTPVNCEAEVEVDGVGIEADRALIDHHERRLAGFVVAAGRGRNGSVLGAGAIAKQPSANAAVGCWQLTAATSFTRMARPPTGALPMALLNQRVDFDWRLTEDHLAGLNKMNPTLR
jgi:hypothetical protein